MLYMCHQQNMLSKNAKSGELLHAFRDEVSIECPDHSKEEQNSIFAEVFPNMDELPLYNHY